ncbi:SDR family oxidoreductase [Aquimarina sp. M1]
MRLRKKRIGIITGASSGIGRSTAKQMISDGVRLILNGRDIYKLQALKKELNDLAGEEIVDIVAGDVSNKNTIVSCIQKCEENWGTAPCLFVACAGRGLPGTLITSNEEEWDSLLDTNVKGLMHQLKAVSTSMTAKTNSTEEYISFPKDIVVIGSSIGRNVSPFNSVYGSTKFATHGLTEALRRELGPQGIRVTLIEPGLVGTNFQESAGYDMEWFNKYVSEVGPVLNGEDVAKTIQFLINMPGNVHLDNISIRPTRQSYP